MKKIIHIALLSFALLLAACSPAAEIVEPEDVAAIAEVADSAVDEIPEPEDIVLAFTDDLGRSITLDGPAQAIVSLAPSSLESLFAIGAGDQVVGREEYSTYPEEAALVSSVGNLYADFPLEAIVALEPDLVIAPQIIAEENVQSLVDLGIPVYWMQNPISFEGLYANLKTLAELTGHEAEADALIADLAARVSAVEEISAYIEDVPSVLYELDGTDPLNPWTTGGGTFIDALITLAGGANAAAELTGDYAQMSSEAIIQANPDVILLADALYGITPESIAERAGWDVITAVQDGQVLPFDPFIVSVPGPRMVEGLEVMASMLHPDLFE